MQIERSPKELYRNGRLLQAEERRNKEDNQAKVNRLFIARLFSFPRCQGSRRQMAELVLIRK